MPLHSRVQRPAADIRLAASCAKGDRAAQEQLFDEQRERVHLVLFRILGSNRDIEDLVQEAFVALFQSLPSYRGEASLATWTDRIAARTAFRYLSRRRLPTTRLELVPNEPDDPARSADTEMDARLIGRRLYAILDRLSPKYRIAFALHVVDERPIPEVAEIMSISVVAAKARIWRARRMVQKSARTDAVLRNYLDGNRIGGP
jgi:RNA polymerase sigma-70 factor (ECF subfamily)